MDTDQNYSNDIRLHTEDPAEGDDPWPGIDIRAHSQDASEGPDDAPWSPPRAGPGHVWLQDAQPETD
ncbi:hypothetical protein [Arthrobacter mobilis]|uniref:Uncharacterized protein n=1 Tax=Arthrobacter mobilis TaxID=2724944 RepID=A0A7X6K5E5_9MICC|nr:hypothetical protein [Arthrobacter mobilis]NKX53690.1 hypothetical protein [Arthrobacter mobilis]